MDKVIEDVVNKGINKVSNAELIRCYQIITGGKPSNGCSECFRRNAWSKIIRYYKEHKND